MVTRIFTFLALFVSTGLMAQPTLTFPGNALRSRDSNTYQEIQVTNPGGSGANQTWDFSKAQLNGKNLCSSLRDAILPKVHGAGNYTLLLDENDFEFLMNSGEKGLEELGYVNSAQKMTLVYSDALLKMKYPFSFGDHFIDHFVGTALYDGTSKIDVAGDYTVSADAFGTLILPGRTIPGVLRVKSVKSGQQINMCGLTDFQIVKYSWYADGYRYPLLNLTSTETHSNGGAPVVTTTANINTLQPYEKNGVLGEALPVTPAPVAKSAVEVVISPNPFVEQLTYSYQLTVPLKVTIELYDMAGKIYGKLVNNQLQTAGFHNGELVASRYGLTPGVYFMRFTFDQQIVISRVVKF